MKIVNYIEDILIFAGLVVITTATFFISFIAGLYVTGASLLSLGIFFARFPPKWR